MANFADPWLTKRWLLSHLTDKVHRIVDVGALKGNVTAKYREVFPEAFVEVFEPQSEWVTKLRKRFADVGRITINETALSDYCGVSPLYVGGKFGNMTSLRPRPSGAAYYRNLLSPGPKVAVRTLEDYCDKNDIQHIHILKMDVHGSELPILRGSRELLAHHRIDIVYTEVCFVQRYKNEALYHEVAHYLEGFGYGLYRLYGLGSSPTVGQLIYSDALFISNSLRAKAIENGKGGLV